HRAPPDRPSSGQRRRRRPSPPPPPPLRCSARPSPAPSTAATAGRSRPPPALPVRLARRTPAPVLTMTPTSHPSARGQAPFTFTPPASGLTRFECYPLAGAYNTGTGADQPRLVTVHFPAPGSYPFEVDYAECCVQGLAVTMGTTSAAGDRIIPPTISLAMSPYKFDAQPAGSTKSVDVRAFDAAGAPIASLPVDLRIT